MLAATSIVVLLTLATVGAELDVGKVSSVSGIVVGADGKPAVGADVLASGGTWDGEPAALIGKTKSDGEGRFVLVFSEEPSACDRPTLWAFLPGAVVGSVRLDRGSFEGRSVRMTLGSPGRATFVVAAPDGQPVPGARVVPRLVAREILELPEALSELASSTTDRDGRAVVSAFRPEEVLGVRVMAPGFGTQPREFRLADGLADVGPKSITLLPSGGVSGRVVAEDPKSVAGLTVRVVSSSGGRGSGDSGVALATTDVNGHFEVPEIAAGTVTVRVRPLEGSPDLPARVIRRPLEAGRSVAVEIPLRRGVRVSGVAFDDRDGRPIAGVVVSVVPSGPAEPRRVRTDAEGRYETFVPAGLVSYRVLKVPTPYLCPPHFVGPRPIEVPPAIARFELPRIALTQGGELRGSVVDENRLPMAGARVEASWTMFDGRIRAPRSESTTSREDGSFAIGPVPIDVELTVFAERGEARHIEPSRVRVSDQKPVVLIVAEPDAIAPTGRVVDPDGQPIAGASVRIWAVSKSPGGSIESNALVQFGGSDELKTDAEGGFRVPRRIRRDREYRAIVSAEGFLPARTGPLRPGPSLTSDFAKLVLTPEVRRVVVEGRVLDRQGRPVVGAGMQTSAIGPCRQRTTTDEQGRFRLTDVPEARGFLFAEAVGYRFEGRQIDPKASSIDLALTRLDEIPATSMTTRPIPSDGMELARQVLAPYADKVLSEGDHASRIKTLELLAHVDPKRVLALIDARGVEDLWFADHLRHAASRSLSGSSWDERMAIVDAIRDAECRVLAALDGADSLPDTARALKRECVERALRDARAIREPSRRVVTLARVAARLIDLTELDQAKRLLEEARPIAESLPLATSGGRARVEFAQCLARIDPASALALTEDLVDPGAFDRCRLKIARNLARQYPSRVSPILDSLRDPRELARALPMVCHALAPIDPALARLLLARARGDDPCLPAYALGMMAQAVAASDKPTATAWLREAFDRLGQVAATSSDLFGSSRDPAVVAAALLPVAEAIDARLVPELFWRSVSLHAPRSGCEIRSNAVLSLMLSRYDRTVAGSLFDPLLDRAGGCLESDLAVAVAAAAAIDPSRAVRLVEGLPDAPDLTFHHPKNEARLALAAALARSSTASWDDAVSRFLQLWTERQADVE
jgi:hypothetical protein